MAVSDGERVRLIQELRGGSRSCSWGCAVTAGQGICRVHETAERARRAGPGASGRLRGSRRHTVNLPRSGEHEAPSGV